MDKRGQIFGLYIVFITLFMMAIVIGFYYLQYGSTQNSLVSPLAVLEVGDSEELFLRSEYALIESSLESNSGEFGTEEFIDSFRSNYISNFREDIFMKEFIFSNLTLEGRDIELDARAEEEDFVENTLYPEELSYYDEEGNLVFGRAEIGKAFVLRAQDQSNINFPIDFSYEFSKSYLVKRNGDGYVIEVLG